MEAGINLVAIGAKFGQALLAFVGSHIPATIVAWAVLAGKNFVAIFLPTPPLFRNVVKGIAIPTFCQPLFRFLSRVRFSFALVTFLHFAKVFSVIWVLRERNFGQIERFVPSHVRRKGLRTKGEFVAKYDWIPPVP